jgi:hypothetical protein
VPEHTGAHIRLLEATIDFTELVESGSSGRHVIAQFKHDTERALGPEQPLDDVPAGSTAKRDDRSCAGFERHASKVVIISAKIVSLRTRAADPGAPTPAQARNEPGRRFKGGRIPPLCTRTDATARVLVTDVVRGFTGGSGSRFGSGVGVGTRGTRFGFGLGPQAASSVVAVTKATSARARVLRGRRAVAQSAAVVSVGVSVRSIHRVAEHRPCPVAPARSERRVSPGARASQRSLNLSAGTLPS